MDSTELYESIEAIAIIGISGRFPGANGIEDFWKNLRSGVESISLFTDAELIDAGIEPELVHNPDYVKSLAVLENVDLFDASFFGFNPREAEITDPQHRLFLECAWEALENAGYDSQRCESRIGVYAGAGSNNYSSLDLNSNRPGLASIFQKGIGNDKDFLATRVSYKLNLTGPSLTVQTACSTSLVATSLACQSLLNYQCDMALAGGVSIHIPQKTGYLYEEGGILSPDGHCRAFDAKAMGTIIGNGVGIVVLKRLSEAIADGDNIYAVIKGSAINNDGSGKVGYTAPSVNGQADVVVEALALAGVEPETISYIEAHGTGTVLGDPIEISALTNVFRESTNRKGFCAIASVKTNIGHLDAAAGIAGLIKTVLALKHQQIPPSLNFEQPNPQIDFANSPFYVNTTLKEWKAGSTPRRAGVSSLGIGGTNAHVILEEAPVQTTSQKSKGKSKYLLCLSAKTSSALETATVNLANYLKLHPSLDLADVAYTLQVGRAEFNHRRVLVCQDTEDASSALQDPQRVLTRLIENSDDRSIVFMFPGQGAQYVDMGKELYQTESIFQQQVDLCCQMLQPHLGLDLRSVIYPTESELKAATAKLQQTAITQPALFVVEYALAKLWMSWGISPSTMIGHSIGEYVAACLAGVMSLEDALALLAIRGRLMQQLPAGAMLSVSQSAAGIKNLLNENLSLAASNAPSLCVVSGTHAAIDTIHQQLTALDIECRRLHTSHAFHSEMMEPIMEPFIQEVKKVKLNPPQIPLISNVTGTWITAEQATDPQYWTTHLRQTVEFTAGISTLLQDPNCILLEVGPGRSLCTFAQKHSDVVGLCSLRHPKEKQSDVAFLLNTLGKLWLYGVQIEWSGFYINEHRYRLPLPTYPFERQHYWIEDRKQSEKSTKTTSLGKKSDITDWFYLPLWKQSLPPREHPELTVQKSSTLVFTNELSISSQLVQQLKTHHQDVILVKISLKFAKLSEHEYSLNPQQSSDYELLWRELQAQNNLPTKIVHLWNITENNYIDNQLEWLGKMQVNGFYSLLFIAQAISKLNIANNLQITVISNNMQSVTGEENLCPEKATLLGAIKVIPQEYSNIRCRNIDILIPAAGSPQENKLTNFLLQEIINSTANSIVAYRGNHRWVQTFEPMQLHPSPKETPQLKEKGVYLITGGLGGIGLILAAHLAKTVKAKLILTGRSVIPAKEDWSKWLKNHDEHHPISAKIKQLQELETLGAEVLTISADVGNFEQMQAAIVQAELIFGQINGVIHAAGITEEKSFAFIEQTHKVDCELQFQPKVYGLLILEKIFKNKKLDFCVLMSSLSSILGGLGFMAYSAVNSFMDAFVHQHNQNNAMVWTSVNWDAWHTFKENQQNQSYFATGLADLAIKPQEGIEAFQRILNFGHINQVVVSTGELQTRINQWVDSAAFEEKTVSQKPNFSLHPRPNLQNPYVAPKNEIEQKIAAIWQELIGAEKVGIYDNFFELGGDSLLMVQMRSRLQKVFNCNVSTAELFEYPTISSLSEYFNRQNHEQPAFELAQERAKKQEAAIAEEIQLMKQRRRV
ncbi:type I polyketide synthase [Gloeocapsopsis dulcis]|uniref:Phenolphthiocerol/phthiocerol polyketide synthase subunit E n=1 Tax=Gloeocapsopsis dulcis AAB1 = 1H9 TaxID=1433147 RepID=A0A6N8G4P3_9CHRO|nr:type I polyketide synthase [Gloeocapsopsis dulcis]MUL39087.1 beta-ketoacyl synthase [Gloeocapsopsis dulcis AAB1 = 1H9]WNN92274.1 SDR family NAD(P)-dependent oxidoreductase [Gloeocapsopsis dulcis]